MVQALSGKIKTVEIEEEMRRSYIDYAMSVIVGRALPDVRDGLKPVHRRILYGMYEQNLTPNRPYRKSARVVGDVMGKYHPHGDAAIYDTLVRMAQDFSSRYELVDGHGNFGSVDGDSPAAMRYTEARLSPISMELLRDIDKDTVDFIPNYDGSLQEPTVLPSRFPNLLANGSSGIAVGMSTNIPPHNLGEVIEATIALIENPDLESRDLMRYIHGPDFPTGGVVMGLEGLREAYETGRGVIRVRGKAHIEQTKSGRSRIVVTEIPFQVNKARLTERIAELVRSKKLSGIADLRDESDRTGMRLVIELRKEAAPQVVLNQLYKHTQLQESFGIIMLALVDGVPRILSLKDALAAYINHQVEVITRRTRFELDRAEKRAHILEGLLIALANLDAVIELIKKSRTVQDAREGLMKRFKLSEEQAQAILDMRLQRLTGMEREKVREEHKELLKEIARLREILADEKKVRALIVEELTEIKRKYADPRRTDIVPDYDDLEIEDLIAEEEVVVTITHSGYVKRLPIATYRTQRRGGKGVTGMNLKEGDFVEHLFIASTHHYIHFFSNRGRSYRLKVYELPEGSRTSRGHALVNLLPLGPGEKICSVIATRDYPEESYLVMATRKGMVKKTPFKQYDSPRRDGLIAIDLQEGDEVIDTRLTDGQSELILVTREGQALRFPETDCRPMGRDTRGVRGINLSPGDEVIAMGIVAEDADLFVITEQGYGKRTAISKYPRRHRGGKGVRTIAAGGARGKIVDARVVRENQELMAISVEGVVIRVPVEDISRMGRATQGVRVMSLREDDRVASIAHLASREGWSDEREETEEEGES
ncbi:DNA gyrase subunit A [Candidatus Solincola tengchongensis]|uniref:DNA gyrase subunit A n=1 Tax=Candidatus Solincola tengchongensis TaxID=2900693 RepID=UPI00257B5D2F|nr:DNA gyrase subunit A [Candidatus Solincola tengchongensis]